jgi:aryl-alcohol dehydrogenase-like predicted oxidoreductase
MFANELGWAALPKVKSVAQEIGATVAQVALAWLASRPAVWGPIASATTPEQVRELCASASVSLSGDQLSHLNAVSIDG